MRKILIALVTTLATAACFVSTPSQSEARGFRFGVGFGIPLRSTIIRRVRPRVIILHSMQRARARAAAKAAGVRAKQAAAAKAAARAQTAAEARKRAVMQAKAAPRPDSPSQGNEALRRAQLEQQAKAEELVRKLSRYDPTSGTRPVAPRRDTVPARVAVPAEPPATKITPAQQTRPQPASCRRFLPGAAITVSVPCSE